MTRPRKLRRVEFPPLATFLKPRGVPLSSLDIVVMTMAECEALRLVDYEGMHHDEAACKMEVSRPTLTRILDSAHRKVADAIVNGKALRIVWGDAQILEDRYVCQTCYYTDKKLFDRCPDCGSQSVQAISSLIEA